MAQYRRPRGRNISGIIVLDKATGVSSNGALQEVKNLFEAEKAGHTGSLDPLATGVLPLCLGEATKVSQFLLDSDKRYQTLLQLGIRTDTADIEGSVIAQRDPSGITLAQIEIALERFRGDIEQTPPMYSALKHKGQPLYKLARAGKEVERQARPVTIYELKLLAFDAQAATVELEIFCSKGTYVRTIGDDLGEALGCGANVIALRRIQAGAFTQAQCVTIERLRELKQAGGLGAIDALLSPADSAVEGLPAVVLPQQTANFLKLGQALSLIHI